MKQQAEIQTLVDWFETPLGQLVAEEEQQLLDRILPNMFGYHLLQVGNMGQSLLAASRILHKIIMSTQVQTPWSAADLLGHAEHLPIASDTLDALILHHTLEFAADPHQVLREVERTLVPEGHVVIIGFNPQSLWGLRRLFSWRSATTPWNGKFLSAMRVKDWLALLGFDILSSQQLFFRPPLQRPTLLGNLRLMEAWGSRWWPFAGAVYVLVAEKKVSTLTPIKPRWRPRRSLGAELVDPAS